MISWSDTRARLRMDRQRLMSCFSSFPSGKPTFVFFHPSYMCVFLHRISFYLNSRGNRLAARFFWHLNLLLTGCDIAPIADIGGGLIVYYPACTGIVGKVGENLTVFGHVGIGGGMARENIGGGPGLPVIGDNVNIEMASQILGPIRIGNNVHIGPGNTITQHVPDDTEVISRNPKRLKRKSLVNASN